MTITFETHTAIVRTGWDKLRFPELPFWLFNEVPFVEWFSMPNTPNDLEHQCGICGSSVEWQDCDSCGGDGFWFPDPESYVDCGNCQGRGGFWECISCETWTQVEMEAHV